MTLVYLDNNGGTQMDDKAAKTMSQWCLMAKNPSSSSKCAKKSKDLIKLTKEEILKHCKCPIKKSSPNSYSVIFTSGATESNCMIIRSIVSSYRRLLKSKPNIIVSAIEHESIISCCKSLEKHNEADIIYIMPNIEGKIPISSIEQSINENTALISVMFANNEIGTINNVAEIGELAKRYQIPYHCDAVQGFGKFQIDLPHNSIDVLSASFHKLNGPQGLGILILKNTLIDEYELEGQITGTQQDGLRGGTENVPAIAGAAKAFEVAFQDRGAKNEKMFQLRHQLIEGLSKIYPIGSYTDYVRRAERAKVDAFPIEYDPSSEGYTDPESRKKGKSIYVDEVKPVEIVILGPPNEERKCYLPNTLLFSVVKNKLDRHGPFCNVKLKEDLDKKGIVVSIGSACHTADQDISHVMKAIRMPENVGRGVIRVSFGDHNTVSDVKDFLKAFETCSKKQIAGLSSKSQTTKTSRAKKDTTKKKTTKKKTTKKDNK